MAGSDDPPRVKREPHPFLKDHFVHPRAEESYNVGPMYSFAFGAEKRIAAWPPGQWESMFIMRPPPRSVYVRGLWWGSVKINSEDGVRLGTVARALELFDQTPPRWFNNVQGSPFQRINILPMDENETEDMELVNFSEVGDQCLFN